MRWREVPLSVLLAALDRAAPEQIAECLRVMVLGVILSDLERSAILDLLTAGDTP